MNKIAPLVILGVVVLALGVLDLIWQPGNKPANNVLGTTSPFSHLSPEKFNQALNSGKYILIDVRTIDEYNTGHIKNAKLSDFYQTQAFSNYLDSLNKNANYLIYCRTEHRSGEALNIMKQKGFASVYDLAGGYNAWVASGFPVE